MHDLEDWVGVGVEDMSLKSTVIGLVKEPGEEH